MIFWIENFVGKSLLRVLSVLLVFVSDRIGIYCFTCVLASKWKKKYLGKLTVNHSWLKCKQTFIFIENCVQRNFKAKIDSCKCFNGNGKWKWTCDWEWGNIGIEIKQTTVRISSIRFVWLIIIIEASISVFFFSLRSFYFYQTT